MSKNRFPALRVHRITVREMFLQLLEDEMDQARKEKRKPTLAPNPVDPDALFAYTVGSAAKQLGVTRQRVHQLIRTGALDAYELRDDLGAAVGLFIRPASVARLAATERKPGRKKRA